MVQQGSPGLSRRGRPEQIKDLIANRKSTQAFRPELVEGLNLIRIALPRSLPHPQQ
ncbi:MAG: hypothetical protein WAW61_15440 [Methylococcaceae bacterium]